MTTLNQWAVLVTLKNVENRLCCDCKVPLTKSDAYCSSYGTWVCSNCAAAHKTLILAEEEWFRHALNDQLTEDEVNFLLHETNLSTSGNTGFNELFERHIPSSWVKLTPGCSPKERALWIRAKYAVELFRIPNDKIGGDFKLIGGSSSRGAGASSSGGPGSPTAAGKKKNKKQRDEVNPAVLPARIVDYFLVVSATADKTKLSAVPPTLESIPKLPVVPTIQTCYPPSDTYSDMAMPELLAPFLFPAGVELSSTEKQPSFFTFVLTDVSGVKLYGAVMHVHELLEPLDLLPELGLPASFASVITGSGSSSSSPGSGASSDASKLWPVVYVPKALVVLSHYPFFSLYRQFLESLYHISLSPSLLPLERYVINFFSETPLPPPGQVEVNFAVNPQKVVQLTRPRRNQLPMIDFSFRPLFMLLSVDNILSVVTALCSELPVCIVCENVALLTPVCETLLAFLFPFTWQGAYIPVLPEHMTEILDAPVPYLMGMQRSYFDQHNMANCANRPAMSVFVDLDNDVVHLGRADDLFGCPDGDDGSELMTLRRPHSKLLSKLKPKLVEFGGCIYHCTGYQDEIRRFGVSFPGNEHLVPMDGLTDSSNAGGTGTGINIMHRDSSSRLLTGGNNGKRGSVATPDAAVSGGHGHIEASPGVAATRNVNTSGSQEYCTRVISASVGARARGSAPGPGLLDPQFNSHSPTDAFNSQELRFAFLRMFVALLIDYQDFISETGTGTGTGTGGGVGAAAAAADQNQTVQQQQQRADGESGTTDTHSPALTPTASGSALPVFEFDNERFLAHSGGDEFLRNLLATQMFAKFMQEKLTSMQQAAINTNTTNINNNSNVPTPSPAENMEVRYFDESILSKNNRSMIKFKKASTPFLSDMR